MSNTVVVRIESDDGQIPRNELNFRVYIKADDQPNDIKSELPFILNSMLKSYQSNSKFAQHISPAIFYSHHHAIITNILARPTTTVIVATHITQPKVILGYMILEDVGSNGLILHYAYTKDIFRKAGIQRHLMSELTKKPTIFTHLTSRGESLYNKYNLTYNPYKI